MTAPKVEDTHVQIVHKEGLVVLNIYGTSEIPGTFIQFSPEQARDVARARDREGP